MRFAIVLFALALASCAYAPPRVSYGPPIGCIPPYIPNGMGGCYLPTGGGYGSFFLYYGRR